MTQIILTWIAAMTFKEEVMNIIGEALMNIAVWWISQRKWCTQSIYICTYHVQGWKDHLLHSLQSVESWSPLFAKCCWHHGNTLPQMNTWTLLLSHFCQSLQLYSAVSVHERQTTLNNTQSAATRHVTVNYSLMKITVGCRNVWIAVSVLWLVFPPIE